LNNNWSQNNRRQTRRPEDPIKDALVSNERIRHLEVRVIDSDGEQLGVMPTRQALHFAREKGLDLIEITAEAVPPVVRIADINKWVYQLKKAKKEQDEKARENATVIKEIQLRPVTDKHDIQVKQEHAREFLAESAKVKIVIKFKGRELGFAEKGYDVMNEFINGLSPCKIEKEPELNGRMLIAVIAPNITKKA
jgi:translation initiation factor IF-3